MKNILIIDDSIEIQVLLRMLLEAEGYHIDCSSNGEEALTLLDKCRQLPDMILLDLRMPIMNGLTFLNLKQEILKLKNIPIVLMSGNEDVQETGDVANVSDVLPKPLNIASIIKTVKRYTQRH